MTTLKNRNNHDLWIQVAQELDEAIKERKRIQMKEKELLNRLIKESNELPSWGSDFKLITVERKGSIDYRSVVEVELPTDFDLSVYRKEDSSYWKFGNL